MKNLDKLELGCGARPTEGYLHSDITKQPDVELDYHCNPWEIEMAPNSLSEVIAIGMMEHVRFLEFLKTLRHIHTLLKPGGIFLFDVPDMFVWSGYLYDKLRGKPTPFSEKHIWRTVYGWQRFPGDEHKCGWTYPKLKPLLEKIGFTDVKNDVNEFLNRDIKRRRFFRPADAQIYISARKKM